MQTNPTAFISYAWESDELKNWVKALATKLRGIGIDVKLDQWEVVPGDQMPHFMEKSVRENDFVLIICTPKYKVKSENRIGGVGYEGDIMTAEILQKSNNRKFIPILKSGTIETSIPSWLQGKYHLNFSSDTHFEHNFEDLAATILNSHEVAPQLGSI
ncbi:MAG TPA: toll/interleukin-1 receptor domain-containing protein, partial [Saprospiraceae bacterium]|nr:toll/interleukin-1 receptor domain-containing protein [Saprospiraceae bacterium]